MTGEDRPEETAAEAPAGPVAEPTPVRTAAGPPRRPDYVRFAVTGAVVGLALAAVLALSAPPSDYSTRQVFLYGGLIFAFLGALAAAAVAVLIEDRMERRRRD